jgi:2-amino-4-hydroxy-6-hydroxymethyldihydropteridine diphosphokinase
VTVAFVGIGANVGDPRGQVLAAFEAIDGLEGTRVTGRSSLYRSAPVGVGAQDDFINAVARLDTSLGAHALLEALLAIEHEHGRERPHAGAPRTLDLDLLLYGDERIDSLALTVPHPRMHQRRFVLDPLLEVAPDAEIPGLGPAAGRVAGCVSQQVDRIA